MHTALVCSKDARIREKIESALYSLGLREVWVCNQRDNALELAFDHHPDLFLLEAAPPIHGAELAALIRKNHPAGSMLLLIDTVGEELFKQAASNRIDAFLDTTHSIDSLAYSLKLALGTAKLVSGLRSELDKARSDLVHRKMIERAKGMLMVRENLTEEQAYQKMRNRSMSQRISMSRLAEELLQEQGSGQDTRQVKEVL